MWPFTRPKARTPLTSAKLTVFDLEMSGLSPARDHILSVGAVRMQGGRILLGQTFSALASPPCKVSAQSVRIHQLTPAELADKPDIGRVLPAFLEFTADSVLCGWHVELDRAFLAAWCARLGLAPPAPRCLDVLGLAQAILSTPEGEKFLACLPRKDVTLYSVARTLGISPQNAHDALGDAYLAALVLQRFLAFLQHGQSAGPHSLEALMDMADRANRAPYGPVPLF